jgi:hypothetical protein
VSLTQFVVETSIIYAIVKIQTLDTLLIRLKDEIEISNQIPLLRREFHLTNHHTLVSPAKIVSFQDFQIHQTSTCQINNHPILPFLPSSSKA